jgi:hypothetical protein
MSELTDFPSQAYESDWAVMVPTLAVSLLG